METDVTHGLVCGTSHASIFVVVFLVVCLGSSGGQDEAPPAPEAGKGAHSHPSDNKPTKSSALHFDPSPSSLVTTNGVESSEQNLDLKSPSPEPTSDNKGSRKSEIVVAPFPISNPLLGSGLVVVGGYLFPLSRTDSISPTSMVGGGAFYTSNGSWAWGVGSKLYLKHDRFRFTWAYGKGQLRYDLYGVGNAAGDLGLSIPVQQEGKALMLEALLRIRGKLFLGPRYQWRSLDAKVKGGSLPPSVNIDPVELKSTTSALGFHLQLDLRDSQFYPTRGSLGDVVGDFFQGTFGSDFAYQSYTFAFNKYSGLSPRQVLALRIFGCATTGHVPFYDLCLLGMHNDIRGYKAGRYRDRLMITTQVEYRLELPKRFGIVGFFGVGEVAPGVGAFNNENLKPAGGGGVRFTLAKKNHVNLRVDYAVGLQGGGVYMGVAEAF